MDHLGMESHSEGMDHLGLVENAKEMACLMQLVDRPFELVQDVVANFQELVRKMRGMDLDEGSDSRNLGT